MHLPDFGLDLQDIERRDRNLQLRSRLVVARRGAGSLFSQREKQGENLKRCRQMIQGIKVDKSLDILGKIL